MGGKIFACLRGKIIPCPEGKISYTVWEERLSPVCEERLSPVWEDSFSPVFEERLSPVWEERSSPCLRGKIIPCLGRKVGKRKSFPFWKLKALLLWAGWGKSSPFLEYLFKFKYLVGNASLPPSFPRHCSYTYVTQATFMKAQ